MSCDLVGKLEKEGRLLIQMAVSTLQAWLATEPPEAGLIFKSLIYNVEA